MTINTQLKGNYLTDVQVKFIYAYKFNGV